MRKTNLRITKKVAIKINLIQLLIIGGKIKLSLQAKMRIITIIY